MKKKTYMMSDYEYATHRIGRISTALALLLILSIPILFCVIYQVLPNWNAFFQGALKIVPMFYAVGAIEIINYVPMLGSGWFLSCFYHG